MKEAEFEKQFAADREAVNSRLENLLPAADTEPAILHSAMRYSVLEGGKRIRAVLCISANRLFEGEFSPAAIDAACAIECFHAYTLIHDDLPALDNDDFRRGRPSCHKRFGEAIAILAGDALQAFAFEILSNCGARSDCTLKAIKILARTAGSLNVVGGQVADIEGESAEPTIERVNFIHSRKTAELISASLAIGAVLARADESTLANIEEIGRMAGMAFQICDDIIDVTGKAEVAGKSLRKDAARRKITYPSVFGVERSREQARRLSREAKARIARLGDEGYIGYLFELMAERTY